jgi:hypothetical protein
MNDIENLPLPLASWEKYSCGMREVLSSEGERPDEVWGRYKIELGKEVDR